MSAQRLTVYLGDEASPELFGNDDAPLVVVVYTPQQAVLDLEACRFLATRTVLGLLLLQFLAQLVVYLCLLEIVVGGDVGRLVDEVEARVRLVDVRWSWP